MWAALKHYYYCYYHCYHLYSVYLQLHTWNEPYLQDIQCCSCSVFTICATCNVISLVKYVLSFSINIFRRMCAVTNMAVYCSPLISCFAVMLPWYCLILKWFHSPLLLPVSHFSLKFHMRWISVRSSIYFNIFSAPCLITFLSPQIAAAINLHVLFLFSLIMMAGLMLERVLSVRTCWFHNLVTLILLHVSTDFGTCSYQCSISNFTPISLHTLKCSWSLNLSRLFIYCSFASIGHFDMTNFGVSSNCL